MNDNKRSILELLQQGKISQEEANRLLAALEDEEEPEAGDIAAEESLNGQTAEDDQREPVVVANDGENRVMVFSDGDVMLSDFFCERV